MTSWRLTRGTRRIDSGILVGGAPLRLMRLSESGRNALDGLLGTDTLPVDGSAEQRLGTRLVRAGVLVGPVRAAAAHADVTIVVPALSDQRSVDELLDGLGPDHPVILVDDGSAKPLLGRAGVEVVRHDDPLGPAAARNAGARLARTRWLAFLDVDTTAPDGWLEQLLAYADSGVVALAPRIVCGPGVGLAAGLERRANALDLGPTPADVAQGRPVSYVPSTAMLVDRETFWAVGGFDESMQVGEDVDLAWRLSTHGIVRFEPDVQIVHQPRTRIGSVAGRRFLYGTSAGPLERRHPGSVRHCDVTVWSFLPWLLAVLGSPRLATLACAAVIVRSPGQLTSLPPAAARGLAVRGQASGAVSLGQWLLRPGFPVTALVAIGQPRLARRLLIAIALGATGRCAQSWSAGVWSASRELTERPDLCGRLGLTVLTLAARTFDDIAYSAGVWVGCFRARTIGPLLPRVRLRVRAVREAR